MDNIILLALTVFVFIFITYVVAFISESETYQQTFWSECIITLTILFGYFYICSEVLLQSGYELISGPSMLKFILRPKTPASLTLIAHFLSLIFFPRAILNDTMLWVQMKEITVIDGLHAVLGILIAQSALSVILTTLLFRAEPDFPTMFSTSLVSNLFFILNCFIFLPLEYLSEYLSRVSRYLSSAVPTYTVPSYMLSLVDPMTKAIVQIDYDVYVKRYLGGFLQKRPLVKYLCSEAAFLSRCQIFPYESAATLQPFYRTVEKSTVDPFYWARNETVQRIDVTKVDLSACLDDYGVIATEKTVQMFTFLYPNFTSPKVQPCRHFFTGSGLASNWKTPVGYPSKHFTESEVSVILIPVFIVATWMFFIIYTQILRRVFQRNLQNVIRNLLQLTNHFTVKKKGVFINYTVDLIYLLTGVTISLIIQDVCMSLMFPIIISSINTGSTVSKRYLMVLGIDFGGQLLIFFYATKLNFTDLRPGIQCAFACLTFYCSGFTVFHMIPLLIRGRSIIHELALFVGKPTERYRWWPFVYILMTTIMLPGILYAVSFGGNIAIGTIILLSYVVCFICIIIQILQSYCPCILPVKLQTWNFLPDMLTSLEPYDKLFFRKPLLEAEYSFNDSLHGLQVVH